MEIIQEIFEYDNTIEEIRTQIYNLLDKKEKIGTSLKFVIKKYGIDILSNELINHNFFIHSFILISDNEIYKEFGKKHPLFIYKFIDFLFENKDIINNLNNNENIYNKEKSHLIYLWNYVFNSDIKKLNYDNVLSDLDIININFNNQYLKNYDVNDVSKILCFTYSSYLDYKQKNEDNLENDIFSLRLNTKSYFKKLFEASPRTEGYRVQILDMILDKYKNLNSGYLWSQSEIVFNLSVLNKSTFSQTPKTFNEKFISYTYELIKNGIVNKNLLEWYYLFNFDKLSKDNLINLFTLIFDIKRGYDGILSDILNQKKIILKNINKEILGSFIELLKNTNNYIYSIDQDRIDRLSLFVNDNSIIDIIVNNTIDIKNEFYKFGIELSDFYFDEDFFSVLLETSPTIDNIHDINIKIKIKKLNNNDEDKNKIYRYIKDYNSANLINKKIDETTFKFFENGKLIDCDFFEFIQKKDITIDLAFNLEKSYIKYEILNLFLDFSFIPENKPNINKQYLDFLKYKNDLSNILSCLINKTDIELIIKYISKKDKNINNIKKIFNNFVNNNLNCFLKYTNLMY